MLGALLRCGRFLVNNPLEVVRRLAVLDDHAAADNGALFPVIGIIGLPVGNAMTCCRKDYACLVGNFGCTGCILKPLVTAVAGVICCVAFLRASRSLCGNEGQIVRMRYGLVISAGVADVITAVIVSRLVLLFVAARAFFPMIVCVIAPIACPCVPELCTCCRKGFCCADLSAGAALEIYCIVGAVGSRLEGFRLLNFLIVGMGMGNCLVCYNNGFVCVHRNIQDIGKYVCCNAVHSNNVDFITVIRGKDNRFGGAFGQSGFACGNRSVTAVYLCCEAIGGDRCLLVAANPALLMFGALLRCGCFLVNNPLEVVRRLIGLIAAGALMPVVVGIVLPVGAVAVSMLARNRQRVGFSTDSHDNVGCAAVGDGNGCAAAGGQSLSVDAHGLAVSGHRCD